MYELKLNRVKNFNLEQLHEELISLYSEISGISVYDGYLVIHSSIELRVDLVREILDKHTPMDKPQPLTIERRIEIIESEIENLKRTRA